MSYSIYKNKKLLKELSDKDYRLLKFNSKLINPFHTYLMYSLVPSELNELSFKDLNYVVEIFKKKINKFVKKKFNKNYVNANSQKDLDIFTELCHLNISIFDTNFDNLHSSTKNKKYTKRLYLINRDNDLFLLIKKDKKGLKLKLGNNVLKPIQSGGTGKGVTPNYGRAPTLSRRGSRIANASMTYKSYSNALKDYDKTLKTPRYPFSEKYYNKDKVNGFLKTYCEKLIEKGKRTNEITDEIDNIIYPIEIIKNENFKEFKSFSIKDKKQNKNFGELFNSRDTLLKDLKTLKKNNKKSYVIKSMENFNEKQDIIGELENFKETKGKLNKDKLEHFKEIIIAAFTDHMRDQILLLIKSIEEGINLKMYDNEKGIMGVDAVGKKNPVRIVISGGSGFNNLIEKENRPISPDIDVKLCLHTQEAIDLHKHMTQNKNVNQNVNDKNIKNLQMVVAKQLLIVRTHLFNVMEDKAKEISKSIKSEVNKFNNMFKNLYKYCSSNLMDGQDIPFLNTLDTVDDKWKKEFKKETVKVLVRETLMKRGIDGEPEENNPYKLHDVFLYSLDLPFNGKTGFDSLAGILDIVVSIPGHIGYILPSQCELQQGRQNCYNIKVEYYTEELNKLLKYGLRTKNKKILKDLVRYTILLTSLLTSQKNLSNEIIVKTQIIINTVEKILESIKVETEEDRKFKEAINIHLDVLKTLNLDKSNLSSQELIFDSQDSEYYYNTNNHLKNLDEQCSQDVINQSSEGSDEYDEKMRQMYIDLYSDITESGSLQPFVIDCIYHGVCGDKGGGSKKNKQIGGGGPCGNVEMLSLSKVFQMMVNNKSMGVNSLNDPTKKINFELDKNVDAFLYYNVDDIPKINFEKLTEVKAKHPNNVKSKSNEWTNEYLSTKASSRVSPFRMSINKNPIITYICNHLINVILDGNINKLCYCYENEDYKPEPGKLNAPSEQEYAAFLLTQCQVLNTIPVTQELYNVIDMIKKGTSEEDIKFFLRKNKGPSRVTPPQ